MSKIFIRGEETNNGIVKITFRHFSPLDKKDGLNEEQLAEGYLIDTKDLPEPDPTQGAPQLYYDIENKKCFWRYFVPPVIPEPVTLDTVNEKVELLMQMMLESEGLL